MSLKSYSGGGSDHPPYCLRSSSRLGFGPVCEDDAAELPGLTGGFWPGLRETNGFGLGFLRNGRRGFVLARGGLPFGGPGGVGFIVAIYEIGVRFEAEERNGFDCARHGEMRRVVTEAREGRLSARCWPGSAVFAEIRYSNSAHSRSLVRSC